MNTDRPEIGLNRCLISGSSVENICPNLAWFDLGSVHTQEASQVAAEDGLRMFGACVNLDEDFELRLKDRCLPSAWKERRIGAEKQPLVAHHIDRLFEDHCQIDLGRFVSHPLV